MAKGRRPSELYQVDFVAALFGGFLLIWLANSSVSETAGADGGDPPSFLVVTAMVYFGKAAGGPTEWSSALPDKAIALGCAHPGVGELLRSLGADPIACTAAVTMNLNKPDDGESYFGFVKDQYPGTDTPPFATAHGLDFDLVVQQDAGPKEASFWGVGLWTLSPADLGTFSFRSSPNVLHDHIQGAVATIPSAEALDHGLFVRVNDLSVFKSSLYSIPPRSAPLSETVQVTNYNFKDLNKVVRPYPSFNSDFDHVIVKAYGITSAGLSCFQVKLERADKGIKQMDRVPC